MQTLKLPPRTPKQKLIYHALKRVKVVVVTAGRRFGKSRYSLIEMLLQSDKNNDIISYWISPVTRLTKKKYRVLKATLNNVYKKKNDTDLFLILNNNSRIEFRSAEEKENLKSETVDFFVIDESGTTDEMVYQECIKPAMLTSRIGKGILIGTPKGKNWFHKEYLKGLLTDGKTLNELYLERFGDDWSHVKGEGSEELNRWLDELLIGKYSVSFHYTSYDNPYVNVEALEQEMNETPELEKLQEYMAVFLENYSSVFTNIKNCISNIPVKDRVFMVEMDRFNQIDWTIQQEHIKKFKEKYKNDILFIVDATGVGDPIYDNLRKSGLNIEPYRITQATKKPLIDGLRLALQNSEITIKNYDILIKELEAYEFNITKSGNVTYSAPSGFHDDCVIALALAVYGMDKGTSKYVCGIDLAKHQDYTVLVVLDKNKNMKIDLIPVGKKRIRPTENYI